MSEMPERCRHFNECGTNGWISRRGKEPGSTHPDRCVCQGDDPTPHKHYDEPPYDCARCSECNAYTPLIVGFSEMTIAEKWVTRWGAWIDRHLYLRSTHGKKRVEIAKRHLDRSVQRIARLRGW